MALSLRGIIVAPREQSIETCKFFNFYEREEGKSSVTWENEAVTMNITYTFPGDERQQEEKYDAVFFFIKNLFDTEILEPLVKNYDYCLHRYLIHGKRVLAPSFAIRNGLEVLNRRWDDERLCSEIEARENGFKRLANKLFDYMDVNKSGQIETEDIATLAGETPVDEVELRLLPWDKDAFTTWLRDGRLGDGLKALTKNAPKKILRGLSQDTKRWLSGQHFLTDTTFRKINIGCGDNKNFVPQTKLSWHLQWLGEGSRREEFANLGDLPKISANNFLVFSVAIREGETNDAVEALAKNIVLKVLGLSQFIDSRSEARELSLMFMLPEASYKIHEGKLHIFLSVNPKLALAGLTQREFKVAAPLYEDIPKCPQVQQSIKGNIEMEFSPLSFVKNPDASLLKLLLKNIRFQAEAKMWKDLRRVFFTFSKLDRRRKHYDILPIMLFNSLDIEGWFDSISAIPLPIIKKFLKWLKRYKRMSFPSWNKTKKTIEKKQHNIFRKGFPFKIANDLIFGCLNPDSIEVRVYFQNLSLHAVFQTKGMAEVVDMNNWYDRYDYKSDSGSDRERDSDEEIIF